MKKNTRFLSLSTLGMAAFLSLTAMTCHRADPREWTRTPFERTYGITGSSDAANAVIPGAQNGTAVSVGTADGKVLFLYIDTEGSPITQVLIPMGSNNDAVATGVVFDGQDYILGGNASNGANGQDLFLMKVNSTGDVIWQHFYETPDDEFAGNLCLSANNEIMLSGFTTAGAGNFDALVLHADVQGNQISSHRFGGYSTDLANDIVTDGNDGYWLYGMTYSYGAGDRDLCLYHLNNQGDSTQFYTFGSAAYEEGQGIVRNTDGTLVLSAHTLKTDASHNLWLLKVSPNNGSIVWEHEFGNLGTHEGGEGITVNPLNDKIYVIGRTDEDHSTGGMSAAQQVYALQIDQDGNNAVVKSHYNDMTYADAVGYGIGAFGQNVWFVGKAATSVGGDMDIWVKKIKTESF